MGVAFLVRFWWHFWQHKILNMPSGDRGRELNINRPESSPKPLPVIDSDDDDDGEDADD